MFKYIYYYIQSYIINAYRYITYIMVIINNTSFRSLGYVKVP